MQDEGFTLDHRTLAALAREVEEGDPIAWGGTALDRDTVYELIASQIAETFAGYEEGGRRPRPPAPDRARHRGEAHGGELRPAPAADARAALTFAWMHDAWHTRCACVVHNVCI